MGKVIIVEFTVEFRSVDVVWNILLAVYLDVPIRGMEEFKACWQCHTGQKQPGK